MTLREPDDVLRIPLRPLAHLVGFVRDVAGAPVRGADLYVQCATAEDWPMEEWDVQFDSRARAARDGSFHLRMPAGIRWPVHVRSGIAPEATFPGIIADAGETLERTFVVGEGREVRGRVVASGSSEPIAGAWVNVMVRREQDGSKLVERLFQTVSDADGRFHLRGLGEERAWLIAGAAGRATFVSELPPRSPIVDVDCALESGLIVEGTVVDAEGRPVALARVSMKPDLDEEHLALGGWQQRDTDESGHVRFECLRAIDPTA